MQSSIKIPLDICFFPQTANMRDIHGIVSYHTAIPYFLPMCNECLILSMAPSLWASEPVLSWGPPFAPPVLAAVLSATSAVDSVSA